MPTPSLADVSDAGLSIVARLDHTPKAGRVVATTDEETQIWQVDPATWPQLVCETVTDRLTANELSNYGIGVSVCDR